MRWGYWFVKNKTSLQIFYRGQYTILSEMEKLLGDNKIEKYYKRNNFVYHIWNTRFIIYLITYLGTKQGFVQSFKYPTSLSEFSVIISIILVVSLLLFFGLNILVKRLFNLILVYKLGQKQN